jgi:glycosyltransferase involved in cell wall biosynthesis
MLTQPGGVQSCALALIRGLNRLGTTPDVLWDSPPSEKLLEEAGVSAGFYQIQFRIPHKTIVSLPDSLRYLAWLANIVDGQRFASRYSCFFSFYNGFLVPDGVPHIYYLSGPPLIPRLQVPPKGVKGWPFRLFRVAYNAVLKRKWPAYEYHHGRNYVINSQFTSSLFREAHGTSLPVVYPPIELRGRSFDPDDFPRRDTILFFSRIVGYKRPEMVLDLAHRYPEFRCVIMGAFPPNRLAYFENLRSRCQDSDQIVFHANPSTERVLTELARARFYVFPAVDEHFGMTTPEAIASGAVPFVHDSGGQREIVIDDRLRFQDSDFFSKFEALSRAPLENLIAIRSTLCSHVRTFSEENFVSRMFAFVPPA